MYIIDSLPVRVCVYLCVSTPTTPSQLCVCVYRALIKDELLIPVMTVLEGEVVGIDAEEDISTRISVLLDTFSISEISTAVSSWSASLKPFSKQRSTSNILNRFLVYILCYYFSYYYYFSFTCISHTIVPVLSREIIELVVDCCKTATTSNARFRV